MTPHGPWKIVKSHDIYKDPWLEVRKDDVIRPDGQPGIHSVVSVKPGVTVLALDDDRNAFLTEEFHYAVGRVTLEGVSGGIDAGECALAAARRELREELGIEATSWSEQGSVDPFTSGVFSPTQLYLATDLKFGESAPEGTERILCVKVPLREAVAMVMDGRITHGPTCVVILKAQMLQSR